MTTSASTMLRPAMDTSKRKVAYAAAFGLLAMAVLAPIAQFGILATLIVPADPAATATKIAGSLGLNAARNRSTALGSASSARVTARKAGTSIPARVTSARTGRSSSGSASARVH